LARASLSICGEESNTTSSPFERTGTNRSA
jgi:hypothetical protein